MRPYITGSPVHRRAAWHSICGCRHRWSAPRCLPTVSLESGEGQLPRLTVANPLARAQIYLHGAHVTAWQPARPRTRALDEPPQPVGRGEADPRRRAHLLPLVRAARDRQVRARTRLRPTAGLDARRGARRRARRHAPGLPARAAGAAARGLAARLRRHLPRDRRLVAEPGARGPQPRDRRVHVRGGAAHLLRRAGRARRSRSAVSPGPTISTRSAARRTGTRGRSRSGSRRKPTAST